MRLALSLLLALSLFGVSCAAAAGLQTAPSTASCAIVDVAWVDVENGIATPGQTVLVTGDRISSVGAAADVALPESATVVDGRGLFLMPGLVDAHVHFHDPAIFGRMLLANGVVLVRDTGMPTDTILPVRDGLNGGGSLGPEMVATGTILDGDPPLIPSVSRAVKTPDEARSAVRDLVEAGADMIKAYSRLERDVFLAIVEEAHALGIKVAGHVPDSVPIEDAAAAGLDSSEHLFGFDKLIGRLLGAPVRTTYVGMGADVGFFLRLDDVDPAALRGALEGLGASGLTVCPTVVTFKVGMQTRAFQSGAFAGSEYVSQALLDTWRSLWAGQSDLPDFVWRTWARLVVELHAAGVPLMVGTDLSVPGILPGFSVHDEMAIWQEAGIPAADVLRSATLVPARFLDLEDRLGTVDPGKTASMVLVRANPLDDVRNARQVEAVFLKGRYFDRAALDRLLEEAKDLARR